MLFAARMASETIFMEKLLGTAMVCAGLVVASGGIARAGDPPPTPAATTVLTAFKTDGVIVRALALNTDTIKYEPCNLDVPFTKDTYSLFKGTKSTTWLGPELPQTPYDFNENNKLISLFDAKDEPKWNPVLMILERDKTLAHAVQFIEGDGNTNVNNFVDHDWEGATNGCWRDPTPSTVLSCNLTKLKGLVELMMKFYFTPTSLERSATKYNEVRLFNYDPTALLGFVIEDCQCQRTSELDCVLDPTQAARLEKVVNAFWYGPKSGTTNTCPAPKVLAHGFGQPTTLPSHSYPPTYSTFSGSGLTEVPVFRLVYVKSHDTDEKPTSMELRYVTSIVPAPKDSGAMDLGSLVDGKEL